MSSPRYKTPEEAEEAFYRAFEEADLNAMMRIFADDEQVSCAHPMGTLLQGRDSVRESWRQLFSGDQHMRFRTEPQLLRADENVAVRVVLEHIYLQGDSRPRPALLATNVFIRTGQGWRMLLHHASPSVIDNTRRESQEESPRALH